VAENPGVLAVGRGDHHRVAAHHHAAASPLTSTNPPQSPRKETPGPCGPPGYLARQLGGCHTQILKSRSTTQQGDRPQPATGQRE
jgi:hypothetical protein